MSKAHMKMLASVSSNQSIDRCASVLRLVAREGSVRAAQVATELQLERSTAHRYLVSMEESAMLLKRDDGSYELGPLIAQMGVIALRQSRIIDESTPFMEQLASESNLTAVLCIWGGRSPVVARVRAEDDSFVHVSVREGVNLAFDSAHGYLFAGFDSENHSVQKALSQLPNSERENIELHAEMARKLSIAEHSSRVRGIRALAAPILGADGRIAATLALVGTTEAVPTGHSSGVAEILKITVQQISGRLSYRDTVNA